jgi:hypothetical protein
MTNDYGKMTFDSISRARIPDGVLGSKQVNTLNPVGSALEAEIKQLKFLLASAPMMDAPTIYDSQEWFKRVSTSFGYMHPVTMAQYSNPMDKVRHGMIIISGSPTKWVMTSLMPKGRVILSPLPIPGLEKILAD